MKQPKDGDVINLTKNVEANPLMPVDPQKKWEPSRAEETTTMTMPFGGQTPRMVDVQALESK